MTGARPRGLGESERDEAGGVRAVHGGPVVGAGARVAREMEEDPLGLRLSTEAMQS